MTIPPAPSTAGRLARALPYGVLIPVALVLGAAPFQPEPHLIEKLRMLWSGTLTRPLDIFDLVLHGSPLALVGVRLAVDLTGRRRRGER